MLLALARLFPKAPIYTLVHQPGSVHPEIECHPIHTSFIQRLPYAPAHFRQYLPLFPLAIETFDLRHFDVVISTSHCVAKGVRTYPCQRHVSYIHTPMRYLWDQQEHYLASFPLPAISRPLGQLACWPLKAWDAASAYRPHRLLANSSFVKKRILEVWKRQSTVLYPPVDVEFFAEGATKERHGFLVVSALVPYKRVDLAVQLCSQRHLPLTVVGEGPLRASLEKQAGPSVHFCSGLTRAELRETYGLSEALLFCGVEDFGIVPVEAMAAGCPVIALAAGGALETVVSRHLHDSTGVFLSEPTLDSLSQAIDTFRLRQQQGWFAPAILQKHARSFSNEHFIQGFLAILKEMNILSSDMASMPVSFEKIA